MMLFLHLGPVQLEVRRRPFAGMMIPPIGEQNPTDIQEHAGDRGRFRLCLFFRRSDHSSQIRNAAQLVRRLSFRLFRFWTQGLPIKARHAKLEQHTPISLAWSRAAVALVLSPVPL